MGEREMEGGKDLNLEHSHSRREASWNIPSAQLTLSLSTVLADNCLTNCPIKHILQKLKHTRTTTDHD